VRPPPPGDGEGNDGGGGGGGSFAVWELVAGVGSGRRRPVASQLLPASRATRRLQASTLGAVADGRRSQRTELEEGFGTHDLAFVADAVPALGHRAFLVQRLAAGEAAPAGAILAFVSTERAFGVGGDPLPPGAWPEPVVVGNYDEAAGGGSGGGGDGIRLAFDYLTGRLSSVVVGSGGGGGGWALPASMALASYLPHVGTHPPFFAPGGAPVSPACVVGAAGAGDPRAQAAAAAAAAAANAAAAVNNGHIVAGTLQNSGAYIFRPDKSRPRALDAAADAGGAAGAAGGGGGGTAGGDADAPPPPPPPPAPPPIPAAVLRGPLLQEVRMDFADWASLAVRVWPLPKDGDGEPSRGGRRQPGSTAGAASASSGSVAEVEWTVGPLPAWDARGPGDSGSNSSSSSGSGGDKATADHLLAGPIPLGREAIFRLSTALLSRGVFFTDSNGREMQQRRRSARPWRWPADFYFEPQAANYHPVTSAAALGDGELSAAVATDRAQGSASLEDGELELMVHRATPADDARGVGEPLRETAAGCRASPARDPDGSVPLDACGRMAPVPGRAGGRGGDGNVNDSGDGGDGDGDQGPEAPADGGGGLIARGTFRVRFSPSGLMPRGSRLDQEELLSPLVLAFAPLPTPAAARALLTGGGSAAAAAADDAAASAAPPDGEDGGIGGGDADSPVRVVTLMRSDGLHGARDAEELCDDGDDEDEEDEADDDDDDKGSGESGGGDGDGPLVPPPPRCGPAAEAAAAADPRVFIVRLAHVFAAGEDTEKMSLPATFDLNVLFARRAGGAGPPGGGGGLNPPGPPPLRVKRVTELSLTAAVQRADLPPRPRWRVADEEDGPEEAEAKDKGEEREGDEGPGRAARSWPGAYWRGPSSGGGGGRARPPPPPPFPTYDARDHGVGPDAEMAARGVVELYPMEVRTFEVELEGGRAAEAAAGAALIGGATRAAAGGSGSGGLSRAPS